MTEAETKKKAKSNTRRIIIVALAGILLVLCVLCRITGSNDDKTADTPTDAPTLEVTQEVEQATEIPTDAPEPTDVPLPTNTPEPEPILIPAYQIVEVDDISVARAVRFRVVVTTDFPISVEEINSLCVEIVEDLKSQQPLNAIAVFVFDKQSSLFAGYSIAKCEYSPNGIWADAVNTQAGEYTTHQFTYEYQPKVNDPDSAISERPTKQEYNLCQRWDELVYGDAALDEATANAQVAEENSVSIEEVENVILKCTLWPWK